jgi:glycosyltransferase involved in cell wall biosynthesis
MAEFLRTSGAGMAVPPADPEAVVNAIAVLRAMPASERERMGERGRAAVSDGYLRRQLNARLIRVIESAALGHGPDQELRDVAAARA